MLEAANMPLLKVSVPPEVKRIAEEEKDLTHSPGSSTVVKTVHSRLLSFVTCLQLMCFIFLSVKEIIALIAAHNSTVCLTIQSRHRQVPFLHMAGSKYSVQSVCPGGKDVL